MSIFLVVVVSDIRYKTNLLRAPVQEPVRAPHPYLERRDEVARARFVTRNYGANARHKHAIDS